MNNIGIMINAGKDTNFLEKFQQAKELGMQSCQISNYDPALYTDEKAAEIREALEKTGFEISAFWAGWSGPKIWNFTDGPSTIGIVPPAYRGHRIKELEMASEFAEKIGVTDIATHVGFIPENPDSTLFAETVSALKHIAKVFKKRGQNFLFETGQETPVTMLRTITAVGSDNLFINFDTANLILYGKANTLDALDVFGKYVRNVHIKDGLYPTDGMELGAETAVGKGKANIPAVVAKLAELGYTGPYTIEREIQEGEEKNNDIIASRDLLIQIMTDLEAK